MKLLQEVLILLTVTLTQIEKIAKETRLELIQPSMGVVVSIVKLKIYLTLLRQKRSRTRSCFKVTHSLTHSQKLEQMKLTVALNKITDSLGLNIVGFVSVLI